MAYEASADTIKAYTEAFFGRSPARIPEQYAISSPINYAEQIKAPVLIYQGRADTRTPTNQIEVFEKKLQSLGKKIEVHWFETGHFGIAAEVEKLMRYQERALRFAFTVLGED